MFRPRHVLRTPRRGIILLVVVSMLTLFAIVGLSFVLYAESEAASARIAREAEEKRSPDVDGELLMSYFLEQFIYPSRVNTGSSLRNHELLRDMYGYLDPRASNAYPFCGTGRMRYNGNGSMPSDYESVNRLDPQATSLLDNTGGCNPPYTYPDLNHMFLAAYLADGTIISPSFRRPTFEKDPWTTKGERFTCRADLPFPMENPGGDVKNWPGAPGCWDGKSMHTNDSIWIDVGFPVQTSVDGRKYKPLFAPLVIDLDNRVNVSVHGNIMRWDGTSATNAQLHASNQGWGPWCVNLGHVLTQMDDTNRSQPEWANLFLANPRYPDQPYGRYGKDKQPASAGGNSSSGPKGRFYSLVDWDGCDRSRANNPFSDFIHPPAAGGPLANSCFPAFNMSGTGSYANSDPKEIRDHASSYDYAHGRGDDRVAFEASNMEALLRYSDTGTEGLTSEVFRLLPNNYGMNVNPNSNAKAAWLAARRRGLTTIMSFDWDRPGSAPYIWSPDGKPYDPKYQVSQNDYPTGPPITSPDLSSGKTKAAPNGVFAGSEYVAGDGRSANRYFSRLNVNSYLVPYQQQPRGTPVINQLNAVSTHKCREVFVKQIYNRLVRLTGANPDPKDATEGAANQWLAQLAANIVDFRDDDNAMTVFNWGSYTDPKKGPTQCYAFGTELPRAVINEAFGQKDNDPNDQGLQKKPPKPDNPLLASIWIELLNPLRDDPTMTDSEQGDARLQVRAGRGASNHFSPYRIVVTAGNVSPTNPNVDKVLAVVGAFDDLTKGANPTHEVIKPLNGVTNGTPGGNDGFYVVGPNDKYSKFPDTAMQPTFKTDAITFNADDAANDRCTVRLQRLANPYAEPNYYGMPTAKYNGSTLPSNRKPKLANYSPFAVNPGDPSLGVDEYPDHFFRQGGYDPTYPFNPYITVDYMADVPLVMSDKAVPKGGAQGGNPPPKPSTVGRMQPYAGNRNQLVPQKGSGSGPINHSFFKTNDPKASPFNWLVHLDRELINVMELLEVSGGAPHDLTQKFVGTPASNPRAGPSPYQHRAPWYDQDARIYRLLEYLTTHDRSSNSLHNFNAGGAVTHVAMTYPDGDDTVIIPGDMAGYSKNDNYTGVPWSIEKGVTIAIGEGSNAEVLTVNRMPDPSSVAGKMLKNHNRGESIRILFDPSDENINKKADERKPGMVNLNTVWDFETFKALCDPNDANSFTLQDVKDVWERLQSTRSPRTIPAPPNYRSFLPEGAGNPSVTSIHVPSPESRPFRGMGQGHSPPDDIQYPVQGKQPDYGIYDTFLRFNPADGIGPQNNTYRRWFEPTSNAAKMGDPVHPNPYLLNQLMIKIYNNITSRSNVFAIWVTVGFFEVTDDTKLPPVLGNEIGRSEGKNVRHRMFAIVDRSISATTTVNDRGPTRKSLNAVGGGGQAKLSTNDNSEMWPDTQFEIYDTTLVTPPPTPIKDDEGKIVRWDQPAPYQKINNYEVSKVTDVTNNGAQISDFTARYANNHPGGSIVRPLKLSAPKPPWNVRDPREHYHPNYDQRMVPYFSLID